MKILGTRIFSPLGMQIEHEKVERKNGCLFVFEDINPYVRFQNVLTKRQRLQLALFFFLSVFKTKS